MNSFTNLHIPDIIIEKNGFIVKIASTQEEIMQVYRLRFEVFNLELGEGLDSSYMSGIDKDEFDEQFMHLAVIDKSNNKVAATYRIQTYDMAQKHQGFYSAQRFDFKDFPKQIQQTGLEVSRACISRIYRSSKVFFLLWQGLAIVLLNNNMRYFFGCSSIPSTNPQEANDMIKLFEAMAVNHPNIRLKTLPKYKCTYKNTEVDISKVNLPQLFNIYLKFHCQICSDPCFDEPFKTITFLTLHDTKNVPQRTVDLFLGNSNK